MLFGTDGPHPHPDLAAFNNRELEKIQVLNLSPKEKEDIFSRTLAGLLDLP